MREFVDELKVLIVDALELEDVNASSISDSEPLFGDGPGLGLDSIDALELSVALSKKYGVTIKADGDDTAQIFSSVASLAEFIGRNRTES